MKTQSRRSWPVVLTLLSTFALTGCQTDLGATWPAFGTYRLPYANGTGVSVSNDFVTHSPDGRYDLVGLGAGSHQVVAAAGGWVRLIVDTNAGHQSGHNNYVWIEHPAPFCQANGVTWPGKPANYNQTCVPCLGAFCNEWTKYSHMSTNSTTGDAGLSEGDWAAAGQFLGYEDDIGHATGAHVHIEMAKLDPTHPIEDEVDGYAFDWSGGGWLASPNLLPHWCGIGVLYEGDEHTAAACAAPSQTKVTLQLQWSSAWLDPVPATVALTMSKPDRGNRVSAFAVKLSAPVAIDLGARRVTVTAARLVRPFTVALDANGVGRLPGNQMILDLTLVTTAANGVAKTSRATGPLSGLAVVTLRSGSLQLLFDAGALGRLVGNGTMPQ